MRGAWLAWLGLLLFLSACGKAGSQTEDPPVTAPSPSFCAERSTQGVPSTDSLVLYEVNLRAFSRSGDLAGLTAQLGRLDSLGVNGLWLMPIYPQGQKKSINSPYSIRDYRAVAAEYGRLADLRALVQAAHQRGMVVLLDWVANHTAWDHPWISEHPDWYTRDDKGQIVHPPGTSWEDVADLNYARDSLRHAMIAALQFWLCETGIDGFRCDYADGVPFDFWQQAIDSLGNLPGSRPIMLAEGDRADHFQAGFDLIFGWHFYGVLQAVFGGDPAWRLAAENRSSYLSVPPDGDILRFTTNHDESAWHATPPQLFGGQEGALAAYAAMLFTGGTPLLYSSQEVGRVRTLPFFSRDPIDWQARPPVQARYRTLLQAYRALPALQSDENHLLPGEHVLGLRKSAGGDTVWALVNLRNSDQRLPFPSALKGRRMEDLLSQDTLTLGRNLLFSPYEYRLLKSLP
jgi:1,4-alpha-glucan branching enzyme